MSKENLPKWAMDLNDEVLLEAYQLMKSYLEDDEKVEHWFKTGNLNLGGWSPLFLFENGRGHKVLYYIKAALWEDGIEVSRHKEK